MFYRILTQKNVVYLIDFADFTDIFCSKPMTAEHHDVLAQSFETFPYVSRIFTDPQGNIVALTNLFDPSNCLKATNQFLLERTMRIIKYSWILDKYI